MPTTPQSTSADRDGASGQGESPRDPAASDVTSLSQPSMDNELTSAPWIGLHYKSETRQSP